MLEIGVVRFAFFVIRVSRERQKNTVTWETYPELRLLRSLALGYHLSPLTGLLNVFSLHLFMDRFCG